MTAVEVPSINPPLINFPKVSLIVRAESYIHATIDQVFTVITDTASYPAWNRFVRSVSYVSGTRIDQPGAVFDLKADVPDVVLLDIQPVRNEFVALLDGHGSQGWEPFPFRAALGREKRLVYQFVALVDNNGNEIAFGDADDLGNPQRNQFVQEIPGTGLVRYCTFEYYGGINPLFALLTPLKKTQDGLELFAQDVKIETERRIAAGLL